MQWHTGRLVMRVSCHKTCCVVCRGISIEITSGMTQHRAGPGTARRRGDLSCLENVGQGKQPLNLDYLMIDNLSNTSSSRCPSDQYYPKIELISFKVIKSPE
jgi:hypothetical protein